MSKLLITILVLSAFSPIAVALETRVLFDFEDPADIAKWSLSGSKAELVEEHATHGKTAVKITYQEGDGLKTFMHESHKPKIDLTGFTHIVFDVYAPAAIRVTFKLKSDDGKVKWNREYRLDAGQETISLAFETTGINPARIDYINLFTSGKGILFLDNLRAENRTAGKTGAPPKDKLLFDFETKEELGDWSTGGVTAKLTDERVTRGKQAVLLTFEAGGGLKTFRFSSRTMPLVGCTHLQFDYFAPVNMNITVKLKSNDGKIKWDREYSLEPEAATHSIPFEGTGIDPASLSYINIWVNSPRTETLLYIDNIRGAVVTAETMKKGPIKKAKPDPELF